MVPQEANQNAELTGVAAAFAALAEPAVVQAPVVLVVPAANNGKKKKSKVPSFSC